MTTAAPSTALATIQPAFTDAERVALAGFLAGYRGLTREAYALAAPRGASEFAFQPVTAETPDQAAQQQQALQAAQAARQAFDGFYGYPAPYAVSPFPYSYPPYAAVPGAYAFPARYPFYPFRHHRRYGPRFFR